MSRRVIVFVWVSAHAVPAAWNSTVKCCCFPEKLIKPELVLPLFINMGKEDVW